MLVNGKGTISSYSAHRQGLFWCTAHASSVDGKGFIVRPGVFSAPPYMGINGELKSV